MWRLIALTRDVKKFRIRRNSKARLDLMFAVNLLTTLMGNLRLSKMNGRTFINLICTQMLQKKIGYRVVFGTKWFYRSCEHIGLQQDNTITFEFEYKCHLADSLIMLE